MGNQVRPDKAASDGRQQRPAQRQRHADEGRDGGELGQFYQRAAQRRVEHPRQHPDGGREHGNEQSGEAAGVEPGEHGSSAADRPARDEPPASASSGIWMSMWPTMLPSSQAATGGMTSTA